MNKPQSHDGAELHPDICWLCCFQQSNLEQFQSKKIDWVQRSGSFSSATGYTGSCIMLKYLYLRWFRFVFVLVQIGISVGSDWHLYLSSFCLKADDVADRLARRRAAVFGERLNEAQGSVAPVQLQTNTNEKDKYKCKYKGQILTTHRSAGQCGPSPAANKYK